MKAAPSTRREVYEEQAARRLLHPKRSLVPEHDHCPRDLEYHGPTDDYTWAETYYIPISVPEERLFAHVYVVTRPVLGTMSNDIQVMGAVSKRSSNCSRRRAITCRSPSASLTFMPPTA